MEAKLVGLMLAILARLAGSQDEALKAAATADLAAWREKLGDTAAELEGIGAQVLAELLPEEAAELEGGETAQSETPAMLRALVDGFKEVKARLDKIEAKKDRPDAAYDRARALLGLGGGSDKTAPADHATRSREKAEVDAAIERQAKAGGIKFTSEELERVRARHKK